MEKNINIRNVCPIIIDAQNDFISGNLGTPEARNVASRIVEVVKWFNENNILAPIFTLDMHNQYDYKFMQEGRKLKIDHCFIGDRGCLIDERIAKYVIPQSYYLTKSTFGYPEWEKIINHLESMYDIDEFVMCGFCTDICVTANFQLLKTLFPEKTITILSDCCAGTTPELHEAALKVMESCQAEIMTWDEFVKNMY